MGLRDDYRKAKLDLLRQAWAKGEPLMKRDLRWLEQQDAEPVRRPSPPAAPRPAAGPTSRPGADAEGTSRTAPPQPAAAAAPPAGPPHAPTGHPAEAVPRRPNRVRTWQDAERMAAAHMSAIGYPDAAVTASGPDGGVDVKADNAIAQVKHWTAKVGSREIRDLNGTAAALSAQGIFYALSGYSAEAIRWADGVGLALFQYDQDRTVLPVSRRAAELSGQRVVTRLAPPPQTAEDRAFWNRQAPLQPGMRPKPAAAAKPRQGEGTFRAASYDSGHAAAVKAVASAEAKVRKRTQSSLAGRRARATRAEALIAAARKELARSARLPANDKRRKDHHRAARRLADQAVADL